MHASEALAVFQNWLSPRPPRTFIADQSISRGPGGSVVFEWIRVEKDGKLQPVLEATYDLSHEFNKTGGATPPLHIHLTQDEYFQVIKGSLGFIVNGKEGLLTPETPAGIIPAGARHTFWLNPEVDKEVKQTVFHCWVSPHENEHGWDEIFFRNFQRYLADCARYGVAPSIFQTSLFRYEADTVLTPSFWIPACLLRAWHHVLAYWIGQWLLGAQYLEYAPLRPRRARV